MTPISTALLSLSLLGYIVHKAIISRRRAKMTEEEKKTYKPKRWLIRFVRFLAVFVLLREAMAATYTTMGGPKPYFEPFEVFFKNTLLQLIGL